MVDSASDGKSSWTTKDPKSMSGVPKSSQDESSMELMLEEDELASMVRKG